MRVRKCPTCEMQSSSKYYTFTSKLLLAEMGKVDFVHFPEEDLDNPYQRKGHQKLLDVLPVL
jgi:protein-disulfide isomerase